MIFSLSFFPEDRFTFLTAQQDGTVQRIDLRESRPAAEVSTAASSFYTSSLSGHSGPTSTRFIKHIAPISCLAFDPCHPYELAVGCQQHHACLKLFDIRAINADAMYARIPVLQKFEIPLGPLHGITTMDMHMQPYVTGIQFNTHRELLASYLGAQVYLFHTSPKCRYEHEAQNDVHRVSRDDHITQYPVTTYKGRSNLDTNLKEVSFLHNDQYVVTGGDCGGIFIWEKDSSTLVRWIRADNCVVNGVAPHPHGLPIIATCGIDKTTKILSVGADLYGRLDYKDELDLNYSMRRRLTIDQHHAVDRVYTESEAWVELQKAQEHKDKGNELFKRGEIAEARAWYSLVAEGMRFSPPTKQLSTLVVDLYCVALNNNASCCLRLKLYREAIDYCAQVLLCQSKNIKALYRRGRAYLALKDFQHSEQDLTAALKICMEEIQAINPSASTSHSTSLVSSSMDSSRSPSSSESSSTLASCSDSSISLSSSTSPCITSTSSSEAPASYSETSPAAQFPSTPASTLSPQKRPQSEGSLSCSKATLSSLTVQLHAIQKELAELEREKKLMLQKERVVYGKMFQ